LIWIKVRRARTNLPSSRRTIEQSAMRIKRRSPRSVPGLITLKFDAMDHPHAPQLAFPVRPDGPLTFRQFLALVRDNTLATFPPEAFDEDVIAGRLLWRRRFIINEPSGIRHVLLDNAANYRKSELTRRLLEPGLGRGLLTSEGETWRRHRRIMAPAFDRRSIESYAPVITAVAQDLLARWDALPDSSEVDVGAAMMHTTLHIISRAMFSANSDEIVDVVERDVGAYQMTVRPSLFDLLGLPAWLSDLFARRRRMAKVFNEFDKAVDELINSRTDQPGVQLKDQAKDLLARLVAARDAETGGGMSAKEVRDEVVTIFMAGHETTAQALTWTWYLLSLHPSAEARLDDELRSVLNGRTPQYTDIAGLRYTRMVIEESMRLYPPAHTMAREPIAVDDVLGHRIPAGAIVLISPWLLHRKASLWPDPHRFNPDRFATEPRRFSYIPFGAGQRICIGAAFAMAEAILILATIAQRYRLHLKPGHAIEPQGLITLRPRYGMPMTLQRRR
jgi:cytochrome P450